MARPRRDLAVTRSSILEGDLDEAHLPRGLRERAPSAAGLLTQLGRFCWGDTVKDQALWSKVTDLVENAHNATVEDCDRALDLMRGFGYREKVDAWFGSGDAESMLDEWRGFHRTQIEYWRWREATPFSEVGTSASEGWWLKRPQVSALAIAPEDWPVARPYWRRPLPARVAENLQLAGSAHA